MNTLLVIVTLASVSITCALIVFVARMRRAERARSDARVAALAAAAHGAPAVGSAPSHAPADRAQPVPPPQGVTRLASRHSAVDTIFRTQSLFAGDAADREESGDGRRRWTAAAAVLATAFAAGVLALTARDGDGAARVADTAEHPAPLELLALDHEVRDASLVVSGSVRIPVGMPDTEIEALVLVFDRSGGLIETVRATTRAGGRGASVPSGAPARSLTFSATIPDPADVGRYRVRFQAGDRALPHRDRRNGRSLSARR